MALVENITVLFTDLVDSTELTSVLTVEAADKLRRGHFSSLRQAIACTGGTEVKNLGDGLMVVFTSASAALACAVAMQQAVLRHSASTDRPLLLRIGVSAGEVIREEPSRLETTPPIGVIGREVELAELADAFKRVAAGEGREIAMISGSRASARPPSPHRRHAPPSKRVRSCCWAAVKKNLAPRTGPSSRHLRTTSPTRTKMPCGSTLTRSVLSSPSSSPPWPPRPRPWPDGSRIRSPWSGC